MGGGQIIGSEVGYRAAAKKRKISTLARQEMIHSDTGQELIHSEGPFPLDTQLSLLP